MRWSGYTAKGHDLMPHPLRRRICIPVHDRPAFPVSSFAISPVPAMLRATGPGIFYGWIVVWAAHVVLFTIFGITYAFSSFFVSLTVEFSAKRADVSFAFALAVFL